MAVIRMATLGRTKNGDYLSRRAIPADVRESYRVTFKGREARFRRPASLPLDVAKREFHEWELEVAGRIERLRADARGEGEAALTQREAHALSGAWYSWFVGRHEADPGRPEQWEALQDEYEDICLRFSPRDEHSDEFAEPPRGPDERRLVHAFLTLRSDIGRFLAEHGRSLSDAATGSLLDALEGDFLAAVSLLRRRTEGDWTHDKRPERFPSPSGIPLRTVAAGGKPSGLTAWTAFELWVESRKPAVSSVNRWRSVLAGLRERFGERDIASITTDEAQKWLDGLPNTDRSAHVVHGTWLRAAKVVFGWAVQKKRLQTNPFAEVSIALPKRPPKLREREFTEDEWRTILRATTAPPPSRMAPHNVAAQRWVPWLCAYTGSRPGEACQLRAEDVYRHSHGFWVMRITPEAGTVKGNAAREVPLHDDLVHQGFPTFANAMRSGPLFYDPKAQRKADTDATNPKRPPYVKAVSKLAGWTRSLGITDKGLSPMHAWRHTFNRRAARAGIDERTRIAFCGHAERQVADRYSTPTLEDLAAEVQRFPKYSI